MGLRNLNDTIPEILDFPYSHLLNEDQKIQLLNSLSTFKYRKKDIIFRQNSRIAHVTYLKSGLVKIFQESRNDKVIILKVSTPGSMLDLMSVFGKNLYQYSAAAITDVEICDIDLTVLKNIILENGKYAMQLLHILSHEGLYLLGKLSSHVHKQLPGRIADVILYFSDEVFKSEVFSLPFTRKELADLAGTTKESFIRTLTEFKNDKIIEIDGPVIRIVSMDILKTLSALG